MLLHYPHESFWKSENLENLSTRNSQVIWQINTEKRQEWIVFWAVKKSETTVLVDEWGVDYGSSPNPLWSAEQYSDVIRT